MGRKRYTAEVKAEAVRLVREGGVSLRQGARELGVNLNTLQTWVAVARAAETAPTAGPSPAEVTRLQREVARLKMERDLLKKAAAFFAPETR